jgi:NAD(P)-dependent dehydrogenase (short-subunit alcohol dehydrogenase family)
MSDVAVVTGAGSGIGRAIATKLVEDSIVILVDINPKGLAEVEKELASAGHKVFGLLGDVSLRETHKKARALAEEKGTLVSWVNCAGLTRGAPLHDFPNDPTVMEEIIGINQVGTFWGCAEAVASFVTGKVKGAVVNISSVHGRRAARDHAVYEMTKGAVDALTRNVATTYGPYGIRANAVAPGGVLTPALKEYFVKFGSKHRETLELLTPLKRLAEPSEIAEVVSFLLSTRASYLSGQSIAVEGAWTSALGVPEVDNELAKRYGLDPKTGLPKG